MIFSVVLSTRDELMQLVRYWTKVDLDSQFIHFRYGVTGSTEFRLESFARRRIARIESLLGKDLVEMAQQEVYTEFGKEQDPKAGEIFLNGTEEEWKAFREKIAHDAQEHSASDTGRGKDKEAA